MIFRQATAEDFDEIRRITGAAREYLASQGLDQWQGGPGWPAAEGWPTSERIRQDIELGYDWLAVDDASGEVLGVVAACGDGELDYDNVTSGAWVTQSANDSAKGAVTYMVLHRMAVAPQARRRGVASFMLESSAQMARERGFKSIRVDTHHGNLPMQGAFEKAGMVRCCDILIDSEYEPTKERVGFEVVL